ncbi:hypothetical protein DOFOFD_05130 [Acetobacteraceae bacterium EV16P]|uniref:Nicotinate-nucleotide--dimethylbenzimidazole phosphoribosyltransferase n=1 Tax=Sorlinia euscelidii TaxID=3081148 RepID=A0ABU7U1P3_9PROT
MSIFPSLASVQDALNNLSRADDAAMSATDQRESRLIKPPGSLGRLEDLTQWYSGWRGTKLNRRHIIVFVGNHGVVAQGVTRWPSDVTAAMVDAARQGRAAINQLATSVDATLDVAPVHALESTADMTSAPAMTEEAFLSAIDEGFQAVSPRCDLLVFGEMGIGNTTVAAALSAAMFGGKSHPGSGVARALMMRVSRLKSTRCDVRLTCICRVSEHHLIVPVDWEGMKRRLSWGRPWRRGNIASPSFSMVTSSRVLLRPFIR